MRSKFKENEAGPAPLACSSYVSMSSRSSCRARASTSGRRPVSSAAAGGEERAQGGGGRFAIEAIKSSLHIV